jgi:hypothetical protein
MQAVHVVGLSQAVHVSGQVACTWCNEINRTKIKAEHSKNFKSINLIFNLFYFIKGNKKKLRNKFYSNFNNLLK